MGSTSQDLSSKIMEVKGFWLSHSIMTGESLSLDYIILATILSFQSQTHFIKGLLYFEDRGNFLLPNGWHKSTCGYKEGGEKTPVFLVCHKVVCNAKLPVISTYKYKPDYCI